MSLSDRQEAWTEAADRYDPQKVFSREKVWESSLVWQSMSAERQRQFLEDVLRQGRAGDKTVDIYNISAQQSLVFSRDSIPFGPVVTRVFSPEIIYYPAEAFGPSGNFLYSSSAEEGFEGEEAERILEMMMREGYSVSEDSLREYGYLKETEEPAGAETHPSGQKEMLAELERSGLSEEEALQKIESMHWTEWHPDRKHWTPYQRALAGMMTQEAYEGLYGRKVSSKDATPTPLPGQERFLEKMRSRGASPAKLEDLWKEALPWYTLEKQEKIAFLEEEIALRRDNSSSSGALGAVVVRRSKQDEMMFELLTKTEEDQEVFLFSPYSPNEVQEATRRMLQQLDQQCSHPPSKRVVDWAKGDTLRRIEDNLGALAA